MGYSERCLPNSGIFLDINTFDRIVHGVGGLREPLIGGRQYLSLKPRNLKPYRSRLALVQPGPNLLRVRLKHCKHAMN